MNIWIAIVNFMKRYFSLIVLAALAAAGCTSVDDTLGQGLVPPEQQMELNIGSVMPFDAYLAANDSIPMSGQGKMFLGSRNDDVFGTMVATAMTDFYPSVPEWNEGRYFGYQPAVDSVFLDVMINSITGDASVEQKFYVYALQDSLKRDSVYRVGVPLEEKVDMTKPIFSFKLSDEFPVGALALVKMEVTEEGKAFINKLTELPTETYKEPWPGFHKEFHGLYFAPADPTLDAAVYEIDLTTGLAGFIMMFHNKEKDDPSKNADTSYVGYDFRATNWRYPDNRVVNINVNRVDFGWPADIADNLIDRPDTAMDDAGGTGPRETVYVQSLGGVVSYLKVTETLKEWLVEAKAGYSNMVIHQALLTVPLKEPTPETMDVAARRMGMYYHMGSGEPIPDYNYIAENNAFEKVTIPYGGYLKRTPGAYRMNVTLWLTQLMLDPENTTQEIWLGPDILSLSSRYSQAAIDAGKMELTVTYTLIR